MPVIDYYLSLTSPWTCMGHDRIVSYAKASNSTLNIFPCQFGEVFSATGGLPLPKRSPERQAYRLVELARWSKHLGIDINLEPAYFPAKEALASQCTIVLREQDQRQATEFAGLVLKAIWMQEKNIAEEEVLTELLKRCGADAVQILSQAGKTEVAERYATDTQAAIARGVFGAPAYVVDDELFWGQDRLGFVAAKLGVTA